MEGLIIILGNTNSKKGKLSSIAKERLDLGYKTFLKKKTYKILLTGGFGDHFNKAKSPHAHYAKQYLIKKGLPRSCFVKFAMSSNTVEDALFSEELIERYEPDKLIVITSDFHKARVKFIFNYFIDKKITFLTSKTNTSENKLRKLKTHEKHALKILRKNGIYIENGFFYYLDKYSKRIVSFVPDGTGKYLSKLLKLK